MNSGFGDVLVRVRGCLVSGCTPYDSCTHSGAYCSILCPQNVGVVYPTADTCGRTI